VNKKQNNRQKLLIVISSDKNQTKFCLNINPADYNIADYSHKQPRDIFFFLDVNNGEKFSNSYTKNQK
jgi:hypothetical protein